VEESAIANCKGNLNEALEKAKEVIFIHLNYKAAAKEKNMRK
jgi:hypothetical protein